MKATLLPIGIVSVFLLLGCITSISAFSGLRSSFNGRHDIADGQSAQEINYKDYGGPAPQNREYDYPASYGAYGPPFNPLPPVVTPASSSSSTSSSASGSPSSGAGLGSPSSSSGAGASSGSATSLAVSSATGSLSTGSSASGSSAAATGSGAASAGSASTSTTSGSSSSGYGSAITSAAGSGYMGNSACEPVTRRFLCQYLDPTERLLDYVVLH
ncbi:hypothetical protein DL771_008592 [Monosporascus sp. 5C6A]|nr:hypothetical protein DL771_008592 [Monosporascus sp. 5C6A]